MHKNGRELEQKHVGHQLQVRIPNSRLEWIQVQQRRHPFLYLFPAKWIASRRSAVENAQLIRSRNQLKKFKKIVFVSSREVSHFISSTCLAVTKI